MDNRITWVGMDVHKENIVVTAVNQDSDRPTARFGIPNTDTGVHRLVKRLREMGDVRCAYEAGPCGYELRRFLVSQEIPCEVVAPSLIPKKPGDRVKTDRRDAENLARLHRMGELTSIRVPTPAQEALRDLVRTRGRQRGCTAATAPSSEISAAPGKTLRGEVVDAGPLELDPLPEIYR